MARYIYHKYNAVYNPAYYSLSWINESITGAWYSICTSYEFNSVNGNFTTSGCGGSIDAKSDGHPIGYTVYKKNTDGTFMKFVKKSTVGNGYATFDGKITSHSGFYSRGSTSYGTVTAEDGTYPANGRHSDGYWYVKGIVAPPWFNLKIDDVLKTSDKGWIKIDGQLKEIDKIWTRIDGVLKEV